MRRKSYSVALCGVFGALSVVCMQLGVVIPIALYIAPALATLLVLIAQEECGARMAGTLYVAVSLISLLFVPDKEIAFVYVFLLGYYPLLKPYLDRMRSRVLCVAAKMGIFNLAMVVAYSLLLSLLMPGWLHRSYTAAELWGTAAIWAMGNLAFYLFDRAMLLFLRVYKIRWQPRLHRMLRH